MFYYSALLPRLDVASEFYMGQNLGIKTRFRWVKTCIQATYMDQFQTNLTQTFRIICVSTWTSQIIKYPLGSTTVSGRSNPVSGGSNMYWGHIYRPSIDRTWHESSEFYREGHMHIDYLISLGQYQEHWPIGLHFEVTSEVLTDWISFWDNIRGLDLLEYNLRYNIRGFDRLD
jgi:hypothetical protein